MTNNIIERENELRSLDKLVAQRYLYSYAKKIFFLQVLISVLFIVALSFTQLLIPKVDFGLIIATYSILAVAGDNLLDDYIDKIKEKASKIQEAFDVYVLKLHWNTILSGDKPEYHRIGEFSSKLSSQEKTKLTNWYEPEIDSVPEVVGTLICQKTNCTYDEAVRRIYIRAVVTVSAVTIILILLFAIFSGETLAHFILTVLFPCVPIFQFAQKNIIKVNKSISNLKQLNNCVNEAWGKVKDNEAVDGSTLRQIQDGIYLNRKDSPLIPDWIYSLRRDKLESQTQYSVAQLVQEYNDSRNG